MIWVRMEFSEMTSRHHLDQIAVEVLLALLVWEGLLEKTMKIFLMEGILRSWPWVAQYILRFVEYLKKVFG